MFGDFFGVFDVWKYFEQVQNHQKYAVNANLIDVWVGGYVFENI
jgi:hypothetical protein